MSGIPVRIWSSAIPTMTSSRRTEVELPGDLALPGLVETGELLELYLREFLIPPILFFF